jgi:hypothetical protein
MLGPGFLYQSTSLRVAGETGYTLQNCLTLAACTKYLLFIDRFNMGS